MPRNFGDHAATLDQPTLSATGTKASAGDNEIIAAPTAGYRIVLINLCVQNESAIATTMILKDGATAIRRVLGKNQGDGVVIAYPAGREKRLATATALNLNLSGANSCGYSVDYFVERSNIT